MGGTTHGVYAISVASCQLNFILCVWQNLLRISNEFANAFRRELIAVTVAAAAPTAVVVASVVVVPLLTCVLVVVVGLALQKVHIKFSY